MDETVFPLDSYRVSIFKLSVSLGAGAPPHTGIRDFSNFVALEPVPLLDETEILSKNARGCKDLPLLIGSSKDKLELR